MIARAKTLSSTNYRPGSNMLMTRPDTGMKSRNDLAPALAEKLQVCLKQNKALKRFCCRLYIFQILQSANFSVSTPALKIKVRYKIRFYVASIWPRPGY